MGIAAGVDRAFAVWNVVTTRSDTSPVITPLL
jgi:hypothetical protein